MELSFVVIHGPSSPRELGENPLENETGGRCLRGTLCGERLEPVGDNLDGASSVVVSGLPLATLESFLGVDEATLPR